MDKTYVGIDNGVSGAIAALSPEDRFVSLEPVRTFASGRRLVLDIDGNLKILRAIAEQAGSADRMVVVCEKPQMNPRFGAKGNFTIGANGEFWRVLLTLSGFSFTWVHARSWQVQILKPFRGTLRGEHDTKQTASLFLSQRYPDVKLNGDFNAEEKEAIRDAMCIALWARSQQV